MTEKIQNSLRDSKTARWIALLLVSFSLLTGYFFADIMSPLKTMLLENAQLSWDNEGYGFYTGAYSWFNVIFLMLIFGGIILDRKGIRFTGTTFIIIMTVGAALNYYALTDSFINHGFAYDFLNSFWTKYSPSVKMSALGYALFGLGVEILGITGSRMVVKWFKGKEMAFAMALQVALSRLGMFWVMFHAPRMTGTEQIVSRPVAFGVVILSFGFVSFLIYNLMDFRLDKEETIDLSDEEEEFKLADVAKLLTNRAFIYIAMLCVLFYSAVFPFMKYAPDLMVNKFGVSVDTAGDIPGLLPIGSMLLTPIFGLYLDYKGKSASIMLLGSLLLIIVHLGFAFGSTSQLLAIGLMILLGIAFSLVPAAMWPAVPKIVKEKYLGSAYALIFYIQNIGLWLYPMIIGSNLESSNPGVTEKIQNISEQIDEIANTQIIDKFSQSPATAHTSGFFKDFIDAVQNVLPGQSKTVTNMLSTDNLNNIIGKVSDSTLSKEQFESLYANMKLPEDVKLQILHPLEQIWQLAQQAPSYNYVTPMLIFAVTGFLGLLFAFLLKAEDKKMQYGLELPNKES